MDNRGYNRDVAYTDSVPERYLSLCLCAVVRVLLRVQFTCHVLEREPQKRFLSLHRLA